jgi:glutamate racemase
VSLLATDGPERFARVGSRFLGESVSASDVELVDLGAIEIRAISAEQ